MNRSKARVLVWGSNSCEWTWAASDPDETGPFGGSAKDHDMGRKRTVSWVSLQSQGACLFKPQ